MAEGHEGRTEGWEMLVTGPGHSDLSYKENTYEDFTGGNLLYQRYWQINQKQISILGTPRHGEMGGTANIQATRRS